MRVLMTAIVGPALGAAVVLGQTPATPAHVPPEGAETALRALVAAAPRLAQEPAPLTVVPPSPGFALGMVSWVAAAADGTVYLLQRGDQADPIVAVGPDGRADHAPRS